MKKVFGKSLAMLLAFVMVFGAAAAGLKIPDWLKSPFGVEAGAADYAVGDIIEFGSYPQSRVTDAATLDALNAQPLTWQSYGYYSGNSNYGSMTPGDYMEFAETTLSGVKYRAVQFSSPRPFRTCEPSGTAQRNNGYDTDTVYWFKYEPLEWRVLDPAEGLVLCETIIDSQSYSNTVYGTYPYFYNDAARTVHANDYATSSMREWLNDDFYNTAFTAAQQRRINPNTALGGSEPVNDPVFLLSYNEARNSAYGFNSSDSASDPARRAQGSDYAKCQGLFVDSSQDDLCRGNSVWFLRSPYPYSESSAVCAVDSYGDASFFQYADYTFCGVRPALRLASVADYAVGDIIELGSYPQSKVTDAATLDALNAQPFNWQSYGYYSGDGSVGSMAQSDYMQFADTTLSGDKYRAVRFSAYRPQHTFDTSSGDTYQDDNGYTTDATYWFKYEPLEWRVLDPDDGLVMCETIIDSQAYSNTIYGAYPYYYNDADGTVWANDYVTSSIREWLNDDFYNTAFTAAQKREISLSTSLDNSSPGDDSTYNSEPTDDVVFLLSYDEVCNSAYGFNSSASLTDPARRVQGSDYAKCQGLGVFSRGNSDWCLRSPYGYYSYSACQVDYDGHAHYCYDVYGVSIGIRPALRLRTSSDDEPYEWTGIEMVGDIIEFGSYPQSRITNAATLDVLNAQPLNWQSYGYYSGNGNVGSMAPGDYMKFAETTLSGAKYRAVRFSSYRPRRTNYPASLPNTYQDDNGYYIDTVYWFKYEPLEWRVLDPNDGLVMCETIIDSQPYSNTVYGSDPYYNDAACTVFANDYATSSIREWLNDNFYNTAFTDAQKRGISLSAGLDNSAYPGFPQYNSAPTDDAIFLLSYDEVHNSAYGFDSSVSANDTARCTQGSDYARCHGLWSSDWFLRSPGYMSNFVCAVDLLGKAGYNYYLNNPGIGIRPALRLETSSDNEPYEWTGNEMVGDIIEFGSYPQSRITNAATLNVLNAQPLNWQSYGYYSGNGSYGSMAQSDYMKFADTTLSGVKYRAVRFSAYRPRRTSDPASLPNTYQDDNGYYIDTVYWFKYEPLEWRVLDPNEGLVMCETIIDSQAYSNTIYAFGSTYYNDADGTVYANDYVTSSIREWLNDDFYNTAFTDAQKRVISLSTGLDNSSSFYSMYHSGSTDDAIFLLAWHEVLNSAYGFNSSDWVYDPARRARGSDYAKCQGLWVDTSSSYYGNSDWRLRSPASFSDSAYEVGSGGYSAGAYYPVHYTDFGIRPALRLKLKSSVPESIPEALASETTLVVGGEGDSCIYGFPLRTAAGGAAAQFEQGASIVFVRADGKPLGEYDILGTGCRVRLMDGEEVLDERTVVIFGDISGDGDIDSADVSAVSRASASLISLDPVSFFAADINGDGAIESLDVSVISRASANLISIDQGGLRTVQEPTVSSFGIEDDVTAKDGAAVETDVSAETEVGAELTQETEKAPSLWWQWLIRILLLGWLR